MTDSVQPPARHRRAVHLLYVPTLGCNLGCTYCYLGDQTDPRPVRLDAERALPTLVRTLERLEEAGVLPFNVSLHGGEPTLLPEKVLDGLFDVIREHYRRHHDSISSLGHRKSNPHVKTNLFRFGELQDVFLRHRVSVSASIDLPLRLHAKHRLTRSGEPWMDRTLDNLRLLAKYPHERKISTTISAVHLEDIPEFIRDIRRLHDEVGLDMNRFNLMFAFPSERNSRLREGSALEPASESMQVRLYEALKAEFAGSDLDEGFRRHWFDEFTPSYCTNALDCGEKFLLVQSDGSVHSCVRGQGMPELHHGNILSDSVESILERASSSIRGIHREEGLHADCRECAHLHLCRTGCPAVKRNMRTGKSYTCQLQKALYRDNPMTWPALDEPRRKEALHAYVREMHPVLLEQLPPLPARPKILLSDFQPGRDALSAIVAADPALSTLYRSDLFVAEMAGETFAMVPQILRTERIWMALLASDDFRLHLRREVLSAHGAEPLRNPVHLQLLRDVPVVYDDEGRVKQEHLFTWMAWPALLEESRLGAEWASIDLMPMLRANRSAFLPGVRLNLFATTSDLRERHYAKQKSNAFYHIQAINLPFPNMEFHWVEDPSASDRMTP